MDMVEIRVQVPAERETEFYRWFADWREGAATESTPARQASAPAKAALPADQLSNAVAWWKTLTGNERAIWSLWIDAAPGMVAADDIVDALSLKGARDIPGILSWSTRKGAKVGFAVDWRFRGDPVTGQPIYGLEDAGYARTLREAREFAETPPKPLNA